MVAIGSGEKTGRGDRATQTRLDFVPERHTDFIFAVIGERYGFMGAAFVLSLYALLFWRALRIVTLSKNSYGTLVAGGIGSPAALPGLRRGFIHSHSRLRGDRNALAGTAPAVAESSAYRRSPQRT